MTPRRLSHSRWVADDDRVSFSNLCSQFLAAKKLSKQPTTHRLYERTLHMHVIPRLGDLLACEVTANEIQTLLTSTINQSRTQKKGMPLGATSIRSLRSLVKAVLDFGVKRGLLVRNVADLVEMPSPAYVERAVVTKDVVSQLLRAAEGTELEAVVPFALGTELRRSEICALQHRDLDLDTGTIRVVRAAANLDGVIITSTKTRGSTRTDYLPPFVVAILKREREKQLARHQERGITEERDDAFVFERRDGRAWDPNEMSRIFSRLVRKHKLPKVRFHDLRHGFATLAFAAGVPLKLISAALGHSSIAITSAIYVHLVDASMREKSELLNAYLGSAVETQLSLPSET